MEPYKQQEILEILEYRGKESLFPGSYDQVICTMISDIAAKSLGHMRTGIDLLRNSALVAENINIKTDLIKPLYMLKEWIIVMFGLLLLKVIITRSKEIDNLRELISKFKLNISIFLMIVTLIIVSMILSIFN